MYVVALKEGAFTADCVLLHCPNEFEVLSCLTCCCEMWKVFRNLIYIYM